MHKGSNMMVEPGIKKELPTSSPSRVSSLWLLFQVWEDWGFLPL